MATDSPSAQTPKSEIEAVAQPAFDAMMKAYATGSLLCSLMEQVEREQHRFDVAGVLWSDFPPELPESERQQSLSTRQRPVGANQETLVYLRDSVIHAARDLKSQLPAIESTLKAVAPLVDEPSEPFRERWTRRVLRLVGELHPLGILGSRWATQAVNMHAGYRARLEALDALIDELCDRAKASELGIKPPEPAQMDEQTRNSGSRQAPTVSPEQIEALQLAVAAVAATGRASESPSAETPTIEDLCAEPLISTDTFGRVRDAALGKLTLKGAAARNKRYSPVEVDRLIVAALAGNFMERKAMAEKWARWGTKKAASKPHASN